MIWQAQRFVVAWWQIDFPSQLQDRAAAGLVARTLEQYYLNFYIVAEFSQFTISSPRKIPISLHDVENLAIVILTASVQQYTVPPHHIWTRVTIFLNFLVQNFSPKDFPPCNKISRFPLDVVNPAMIIF